jgi:hypothetical protein
LISSAAILGLITAKIASDKGGSFLLWFIGGALLGIITLPLAIFLSRESISGRVETKKCPQCAELVKPEALICRFCRYEFKPTDNWPVT